MVGTLIMTVAATYVSIYGEESDILILKRFEGSYDVNWGL